MQVSLSNSTAEARSGRCGVDAVSVAGASSPFSRAPGAHNRRESLDFGISRALRHSVVIQTTGLSRWLLRRRKVLAGGWRGRSFSMNLPQTDGPPAQVRPPFNTLGELAGHGLGESCSTVFCLSHLSHSFAVSLFRRCAVESVHVNYRGGFAIMQSRATILEASNNVKSENLQRSLRFAAEHVQHDCGQTVQRSADSTKESGQVRSSFSRAFTNAWSRSTI